MQVKTDRFSSWKESVGVARAPSCVKIGSRLTAMLVRIK